MIHLSNYDFIFGAIIILSTLLALFRGGVAELLSLSTWFIALFIMHNYAAVIEPLVPAVVTNPLLHSLIIYIIAFIVVAIIITILKKIFHKAINTLGLGGLNYMLGGIFGAARGLILCALLIIILEIFNTDTTKPWNKSLLAPVLTPMVTMITEAFPHQIKTLNLQQSLHTRWYKLNSLYRVDYV